MSQPTDAITPAQVLASLGLTGANAAAAGTILNNSSLTGHDLAALGVLLKNEVGSNVDGESFGVSQPVSGGAAGNSGWTIGVTQMDLHTNPDAAKLLSVALTASKVFSAPTVTAITNAFVNGGTSSTVNLPSGVTLQQIDNALHVPAAEQVITGAADQSVLDQGSALASTVSQLTDPSLRADLTPGSSSFDSSAWLALMDYSNQFHGVSTTGPMFQFLNTGTASFPGGAQNFTAYNGAGSSLATNIQAAELATKYVDNGGTFNVAAFTTIANRESTQSDVAGAYAAANSTTADGGSHTYFLDDDATINIGHPGSGGTSDGYSLQNAGTVTQTGTLIISTSGQSDFIGTYDQNGITISVPQASLDQLTATGCTLDLGQSGTLTLSGTHDTVDITTGGDTLNASGTTVNLGSGFAASIVGNSNTLTSGTADAIGLTGTGDIVNATGDTINLAANSSVQANGNADTVTLGSLDTLGVTGTNQTLDATGDTITLGAASSASLHGSNDVLTLGTGDFAGLYGTGLSVSATVDNLALGAGASATVTGGGDTLTFGGNGVNLRISASAVSETAGLAGSTINGSNDTLTLGTADAIGITGTREVVNGSADTISGAANTPSVHGSGDVLALSAAGDGVQASNDTVVEASGITTANVAGNGDVLDLGAHDAIGVSGTGDIVNANADTVNLAAGSSVQENGSGDTLVLGGAGDSVNGSNDMIVETAGIATANVGGSGDVFDLAAGDAIGITGTSETVNASGATVDLGASTTLTQNGSGDTLVFAANGDGAQASGDRIVETAGLSTANVTGNNDVFTLAGSDGIGVTGGNETWNGNGDTISLGAGLDALAVRGALDSEGLRGEPPLLIERAAGGGLRVVQGGSHRLAQAAEAHRAMEVRETGRIVPGAVNRDWSRPVMWTSDCRCVPARRHAA